MERHREHNQWNGTDDHPCCNQSPWNFVNESATKRGYGDRHCRVRYYGPPINSHEGRAKAYCGGDTNLAYDAVRLESPTVATPDWDRDGDIAEILSFDVNYDGPGDAAPPAAQQS